MLGLGEAQWSTIQCWFWTLAHKHLYPGHCSQMLWVSPRQLYALQDVSPQPQLTGTEVVPDSSEAMLDSLLQEFGIEQGRGNPVTLFPCGAATRYLRSHGLHTLPCGVRIRKYQSADLQRESEMRDGIEIMMIFSSTFHLQFFPEKGCIFPLGFCKTAQWP